MSQTAYAAKVEEAFRFLQEANFTKFKTQADLQRSLERMGGTTAGLLAQATWEDLEDGLGVPRLIARGLAKVFRSNTLDEDSAEKIELHKSITGWPVELILRKLDPTKPKSPEAVELKRRFGDRPIIVFDNDGTYLEGQTAKVIAAAERDEPSTDYTTMPDGTVVSVYPVGYGPFRLKDACPLHPDTPLVDGRCYKCQLPWGNIPKEFRQYLHFVMKQGFVKPDDRAAIHNLYDSIAKYIKGDTVDPEAYTFLGTRYPEAVKAYNDAKNRDQLPNLTLDIGANGSSGSKNDPFGGENKRY